MTVSHKILLLSTLFMVGCSSVPMSNDDDLLDKQRQKYRNTGSLFGEDALVFGGGKKNTDGGGLGIGVNAYLWRATLDVLSFMPLKSADPFGGVIITDWYSSPSAPQERIKVDVVILDRQLRADGLRISAFRQELRGGQWIDVAVDPSLAGNLENTILTKARSLKAKGA